MNSTSETGHARNVANANLFNSYAANLGAIYKPSNPELELAKLQTIYTKAFAEQEEVNTTLPPYTLAVKARQAVFAPINKKLTKLEKAYKTTTGVTAAQMENFQTIARKIKGTRKDPPAASTPPATQPDSHSVSQLSFDQRTNNYGQLIELFNNTPNYGPNEQEYTIPILQEERSQMRQTTQQVAETYFPLSQARTRRNETLYTNDNNLVDTFNLAKDYISMILDKKSPEYKAFAKLKFKKIES